ncbi:MAG: hypothetical protein LAN84_05885 [Acidobacteriia bacterium]|nr:hypothetical protein [Terriglobia bacterium]
MLPAHSHRAVPLRILRLLLAALFLFAGSLSLAASLSAAPNAGEILPLDQVRPGMQGYAYTIFAGDQIEKFDLEVIGVMPNFLGPKQSIILVQLKGPKVEHTGVVAGMSGSPVYLEGKLAGALSLKLGIFTKEPIAGVTPIQDVLQPEPSSGEPRAALQPFFLPGDIASHNALPSGSSLEPIDTPLVFSGFQPGTLQQFAPQLAGYGFVAAQGGTAAPRADDVQLHPGDMAGMVLVQGDASISSACTVTAIRDGRVYLCGHPFLKLGSVNLPMARSRVLTTLSSDLASTKIVNVGGPIGAITDDYLTAVVGKLGPPPPLVPLDLTVAAGGAEKKYHFELVNHPKLTPLLVAMTTMNGLTQNALYGEGTTLRLQGEVRIKSHSSVHLENIYAPGDTLNPDGLPVAMSVQNVFARLFANSFEEPSVEGIALRVESTPGRRSYTIESAWLENSEARPGDTLRVRVLLRPYRGAPRIQELAVRVPEQIARGATLRVLVSDADSLTRASRGFFPGGAGSEGGLEQLISLLNRERRNDRLYAGLFAPSPTLLWAGKEMPNIPLSQIGVLDGRPAPGGLQILRESLASEDSAELDGPVAGTISLTLVVR